MASATLPFVLAMPSPGLAAAGKSWVALPNSHHNKFLNYQRENWDGLAVSRAEAQEFCWTATKVGARTMLPVAATATQSPATQIQAGATKGNAVVVGAGPAGCLMAIYLIRRGFYVHLFERRPLAFSTQAPEQVYVGSDSRSYTILLTSRGVRALERAEIKVPSSLLGPLVGGCVHLPNGNTRVFKYSSDPALKSYGVSRNAFVAYLQEVLLKRYPNNVSAHFGWELVNIDDERSVAVFQPVPKYIDQGTELQMESMEVKFDLLVGADGVSSKTRTELLKLDEARRNDSEASPLTLNFTRNPEFYKSFHVPPSLAKASPLYAHHNYVQSWPALNMLLVGMADGSFWGGSKNPELMNASTASEVDQLFRQKAPEVYDLLLQEKPNFPESYLKQPAISFGGAVILSRFNHRNIVLIGDAAHAMFPSYGTGCNVALEDCLLFDQILEEMENSEGKIEVDKAAAEFTRKRLDDAHAIVEMNSNLVLFTRGFLGILQTTILSTLHKLFPSFIRPTSYQLLWSDVPFKEIRRQKRLENLFFYGLLAILGAIAVLLILRAFSLV